jgi:hypothetical protein
MRVGLVSVGECLGIESSSNENEITRPYVASSEKSGIYATMNESRNSQRDTLAVYLAIMMMLR